MSDSATPGTVAHQAPLSVGFSRQEYWSGLHSLLQGIFPTQGSNPGLLHWKQILYHLSHQSTMLCYVLCLVAQSCPTLCDPMDYTACQAPLCPWASPGKNTGVGCHALFPGDPPNPGIKPRSPVWQVDSLLSEPPGKPKNTGVGGLSPSPGESSQPRNRTRVSCIAGGFFTS